MKTNITPEDVIQHILHMTLRAVGVTADYIDNEMLVTFKTWPDAKGLCDWLREKGASHELKDLKKVVITWTTTNIN